MWTVYITCPEGADIKDNVCATRRILAGAFAAVDTAAPGSYTEVVIPLE
jgi:hypothetical protein